MSQLDRYRGGFAMRGHQVNASEDGDWFQVYINNNTVVNSNAYVPWDTLTFLNSWTYNAGIFTLTNGQPGIYTLSFNTAQIGGVGSMVLSIVCGSQNQLMVVPNNALSSSITINLIMQAAGTIVVSIQNITLGAVTIAGQISGIPQTTMYMSRSSF